MKENKDDSLNNTKVFQVKCPCCNAQLWIDRVNQEVLKSEKEKAKKESLDELLVKEAQRKGQLGRKFEATAELEKESKKKAEEAFKKAFNKLDDD
jgi:hypothetical protein